MQDLPAARTILEGPFELAEGPLWHPELERLFFVDIPKGEVHSCAHDGSDHRVHCSSDQPVGGFTFQKDGSLLLFRKRDIASLAPGDHDPIPIFDFTDSDADRFNDVIACPNGSVLAGTIGARKDSGALYHVATNGTIARVHNSTHVANGMAFTPDGSAVYFTDSTRRTILRFPWTGGEKPLGPPETHIELSEDETGTPDGLTIDGDGMLYSARWDGGGVYIYKDAEGPHARIPIPVPRCTACTIGGPNNSTLFITSSQGGIYAASIDAKHRPEFRSDIKPGASHLI